MGALWEAHHAVWKYNNDLVVLVDNTDRNANYLVLVDPFVKKNDAVDFDVHSGTDLIQSDTLLARIFVVFDAQAFDVPLLHMD